MMDDDGDAGLMTFHYAWGGWNFGGTLWHFGKLSVSFVFLCIIFVQWVEFRHCSFIHHSGLKCIQDGSGYKNIIFINSSFCRVGLLKGSGWCVFECYLCISCFRSFCYCTVFNYTTPLPPFCSSCLLWLSFLKSLFVMINYYWCYYFDFFHYGCLTMEDYTYSL